MSEQKAYEGPNKGFLRRAHTVFTVLGGIYVLAIIFLAVPVFQSHVLYLNAFKYPFWTQYDAPEKYGLAPGKTLNLHLTTPDNVTLGAWFILSDPHYRSLPFPPSAPSNMFESTLVPKALNSRTTILFFHGNAATRAAPYRVSYYQHLTARLDANVFAIDYRGFGDSEGVPTQDGLAIDARAAWDWLIEHGADPEDVLILGHSLGTAVAARLAVELSEEDVKLRGVTLMSPFSSIKTLLETYAFFGIFPLMKPLGMIPGAKDFVTSYLVHTFDTLSVIKGIKAPVLLAHAENDWDIPHTHSEMLFDTLMEPLLPPLEVPPLAMTSWNKDQWDGYYATQSARGHMKASLVNRHDITNFGSVETFSRDDSGNSKVVLLRTQEGGHNIIGTLEGLHDVIRYTFALN